MTVTTIDLATENITPYADQWKYRDRTVGEKTFVVWDGEGFDVKKRHQYTYLCCYDNERYVDIADNEGLSTLRCLKLLTSTSKGHPKAVHVVYGGSYDFNMILRDVPEKRLRELYESHRTKYQGYTLRLTPRKCLSITSPTNEKIVLWDVIGFFQSSFLTAIEKWDIDLTPEEWRVIEHGKKQRSAFTPKDHEKIAAYCRTELVVFMRLMEKLAKLLYGLKLALRRWDGAGAVASCFLTQYGIREKRREPDYASEFYERVRRAYAGGRIELLLPGDHQQNKASEPIWHSDLNSAYASFIAELPNLNTATWRYCNKPRCHLAKFDLCHVVYSGDSSAPAHPFYHRAYDGTICYPAFVDSWYWAPEVLAAKASATALGSTVKVSDHYHLEHDGSQPFHFVREQYQLRREMLNPPYQAEEKVFKLTLATYYGKLAQQSGWHRDRDDNERIPTYHQLEWAGWVTSSTRAAIWRAIAPVIDGIIAIETDGIYSRKPLNIAMGDSLGAWTVEPLSRITYVQSGVYFTEKDGRVGNKYRGIDQFDRKGQPAFTRENLFTAWKTLTSGGSTSVALPSTRFVTLGAALQATPISPNWRQWITSPREISLIPVGKRFHPMSCHDQWGEGLWHETLPLVPDEDSWPFAIEWVSEEERLRHQMLMAQMESEREDYEQWE